MTAPSSNPGVTRSKAQAVFARRILPAMIGLLAFALLAAATALVQIATRLDRDALDQSRFLAGMALDAQQRWIQRTNVDNAFWGDAYANLHRQTNLDWAYHQENLGPTLYRDFGYEAVLVIDGQGETRYSVIRGELQTLDAKQWLDGGLQQLLERAREAVRNGEAAAGLLRAGGTPAMVSASVMTTAGSDVEEVPGPASILLFVDLLDAKRLLELGAAHAVPGLRIASDTEPAAEALIERALADASPIRFTWSPAHPGRHLLWTTLPILAAVALGLGLLAWLLLQQGLKTVKILDASYARLSSSRAALAASEKRFRDVAESASDWLWEIDRNTCLTYLSSRFEEITGHSRSNWLGRPMAELLNADETTLRDWLAAPDAPLRCSYHAADGGQRHYRLSARAILLDGANLGFRGTAADITEETRAQAHIHYLSQHDPLTGLPNRSRLQEHLTAKLHALNGANAKLTLLYIDLDRFKPVNDTMGHAAGDEVLVRVAERLRQCIRADDLVARIGGDEFVMVISRLRDQDDVRQLCTRLLESLAKPFGYGQQQVFIGASIGVAIAPQDSSQASELLRCADVALYQAKNSGRGNWCLYDREMGEHLHQRSSPEAEPQDANETGQFVLHYQPRQRNGDSPVSAEALLPWQYRPMSAEAMRTLLGEQDR
ncbi:sensor domain-containing diguanylate cyclase [Stutzerimonas nitrititolerans]|uniref:sensor domain-containing diguanylate cyclase n=1 Tax=Stutzerimonas nitrititolerans TaxID=2482751 RepID=UPI00289A1ECA|nr:diguanylate cyclase [Stutzerimonas nitrititolerans]